VVPVGMAAAMVPAALGGAGACPSCIGAAQSCDVFLQKSICAGISYTVATIAVARFIRTAPPPRGPPSGAPSKLQLFLVATIGTYLQNLCQEGAVEECEKQRLDGTTCKEHAPDCQSFCCCPSELPLSCSGACPQCCCPANFVPFGPNCECVPG
jgi:hypothetical protein